MAQPSRPGGCLGLNVGQCLLMKWSHRCQGTQPAHPSAKPHCTGNAGGGALEPELVLSFLCASHGPSVGRGRNLKGGGCQDQTGPEEVELRAAEWRMNGLREKLAQRPWPGPW